MNFFVLENGHVGWSSIDFVVVASSSLKIFYDESDRNNMGATLYSIASRFYCFNLIPQISSDITFQCSKVTNEVWPSYLHRLLIRDE